MASEPPLSGCADLAALRLGEEKVNWDDNDEKREDVLGFFDRFRVCVSRNAYDLVIILLFTLFQQFLRLL